MVMMVDWGDSQMVLAAGDDWCNSGKWQCCHLVKGKREGGEDLSIIRIWVKLGVDTTTPTCTCISIGAHTYAHSQYQGDKTLHIHSEEIWDVVYGCLEPQP
jgi:hypothetical protein